MYIWERLLGTDICCNKVFWKIFFFFFFFQKTSRKLSWNGFKLRFCYRKLVCVWGGWVGVQSWKHVHIKIMYALSACRGCLAALTSKYVCMYVCIIIIIIIINPFTFPACTISGTDERMHRWACKHCIFRSCSIYFQYCVFWWISFHMPVRKEGRNS